MDSSVLRIVVAGVMLLAGAAPALSAGNLGLVVNGYAMHLTRTRQALNERNYGLGFQYDAEPRREWLWFAFGSGFRDSFDANSFNLGTGLRYRAPLLPGSDIHLDLGGAALLMTREDYRQGNPFPVLLPVASLGTRLLALNVTFVPEVHPSIVPLLFFQLVIYPTHMP